jgi:uncharacterized protein (DUF924 family)
VELPMWVDDVLKFWFEETEPENWFTRSDGFDEEVRRRFGSLHESLLDGQVTVPRSARAYLAEIIVLDQFSRNLHRGLPSAFAADSKALERAKEAIELGFDRQVTDRERAFFYMPLMHSESLDDQEKCVRLFAPLGNKESMKYAVEHRDIIERFGRFPHRNLILERESTPAEIEFMKTHAGF